MTDTRTEATARAAWAVMCELVLDNQRRNEVSEAVGLPFARVRALRRIANSPMTMGELATALGVDAPNCTTVVDDLEERGLVKRKPHPTDRRSRLVVTTAIGARLAKRANRIMDRPPPALRDLTPQDLDLLADVLARVRTVAKGA
ncbi:MAG: MarR family winged helix-turn-helix transcriptional regulator [Acidimicrobiales bacterium]